jgi:hypothetical protein
LKAVHLNAASSAESKRGKAAQVEFGGKFESGSSYYSFKRGHQMGPPEVKRCIILQL